MHFRLLLVMEVNTINPDQAVLKGYIMYFLVNPSPPKLLDVATSNFAGA